MIDFKLGFVATIDGEPYVIAPKAVAGIAVFGPYARVEGGAHVVEFGLIDVDPDPTRTDGVAAIVDVTSEFGNNVLGRREIRANELTRDRPCLFELAVEFPSATSLEFRIHCTGARDLGVRLRRRLSSAGVVEDFPPAADAPFGDAAAPPGDSRRRPCFSRFASLDREIRHSDGKAPLFWAMSHGETRFGNFGDALSPVVVTALSGLDAKSTPAGLPNVRLVAAGTLMNDQSHGYAHIWGTGLVGPVYHFVNHPESCEYSKPSSLSLRIHAVRGALTRKSLLAAGVECPAIYGDPGWLLPKIIPEAPEKIYELGVIPHISELRTQTPDSDVLESLKRYDVGSEGGIKVISTRHPPTWEGFVAKIREITSCKRILSASFHGQIVAEAYGIPSMNFYAHGPRGLRTGDARDDASKIDFRLRDFRLGAGYTSIPFYAQPREEMTDWSDVIKAIDASWAPLTVDTEAFVAAFPLTLLDERSRWNIPQRNAARICF